MEQCTQSKWEVWLRRASVVLFAVSILMYVTALEFAGGSILRFLWYAVVFCMILMPGVRVTELLMPQLTRTEKIPVSFAMGVGVLFLCYITLGRLTVPPMWAMLVVLGPMTIWQGYVYVQRIRKAPKKIPKLLENPGAAFLLIAFAGGLFVFSFTGVLGYAKASAAGNMIYHQDMLWRTANAASVQLGAPLMNMQSVGSQLRYHYLGDAISGFGAMFSGVLPYEATCFYHYPFLLFAMVFGLFSAARAYGASEKAASILPFAVLFFNSASSMVAVDIMLDMNGVATATALTTAVLIFLFRVQRDETIKPTFYIAYAVVILTLLMSKNLYGMLLTCALLAAVVFGAVFQRRFYGRGLLLAGIGGGVFALCWHFVYQYAVNNLLQEFWITPKDFIKTLLTNMPLGVVLWLIAIVLSIMQIKKLSFARLVVHAATIGGMLAFFLFHHYSASQNYFLIAALLFMWFCALDTEKLLTDVKPLRIAAGVLACLCVVSTAIGFAPAGRKGFQVMKRSAGIQPDFPWETRTITRADEQAAMWLRENMKPDEVFATNRNARDPYYAREGIWHYYTAMSGRQAYMEGWMYSLTYGHDYWEMRRQLEQISDGIFACQDTESAFAMARAEGIDYLLVTKWLKSIPFAGMEAGPVKFEGAEPVFENSDTAIYRVPQE